MLREFLTTLQSLPSVPPADLPRLATISTRAFDLVIDFLRDEKTFSHCSINALATLAWHLIGNKEIPMLMHPDLPSLHFFCMLSRTPQKDVVFYALPYGYLDLVRADQIMQCCALVNMASQGCDYYARHLDPQHTPLRAQAYEAEVLLALRPLMQAEHLPWHLNPYLQSVLQNYPAGVASLPGDQRYTPPSYPARSSFPSPGKTR